MLSRAVMYIVVFYSQTLEDVFLKLSEEQEQELTKAVKGASIVRDICWLSSVCSLLP